MLYSMTGFARESLETEIGTLAWELKAVNHRYLDLQFRLPEELKGEEQNFRKQAGAALRRGKVECSLFFRRPESSQADLELNRELVSILTEKIEEMRAASHDYGSVNPVDILRWPGVVQPREVDTAPLFAKADVPHFNWHGLRHFAISTWIEQGLPMKTIQGLAGHSSMAMTADRYGHLFKSDAHQAAMDRIASELFVSR